MKISAPTAQARKSFCPVLGDNKVPTAGSSCELFKTAQNNQAGASRAENAVWIAHAQPYI